MGASMPVAPRKWWQNVLLWLTNLLNAGHAAGYFQRDQGPRPVARVLGMASLDAPPPVIAVLAPDGETVPYTRVEPYSVLKSIAKGLRVAGQFFIGIGLTAAVDAIIGALADKATITALLLRLFADHPMYIGLVTIFAATISGAAETYRNKRKQAALKTEAHV